MDSQLFHCVVMAFVLPPFPGEIHVWNTGVEGDPLLASSGFTDLGHKEPVAKVVITGLNLKHSLYLVVMKVDLYRWIRVGIPQFQYTAL